MIASREGQRQQQKEEGEGDATVKELSGCALCDHFLVTAQHKGSILLRDAQTARPITTLVSSIENDYLRVPLSFLPETEILASAGEKIIDIIVFDLSTIHHHRHHDHNQDHHESSSSPTAVSSNKNQIEPKVLCKNSSMPVTCLAFSSFIPSSSSSSSSSSSNINDQNRINNNKKKKQAYLVAGSVASDAVIYKITFPSLKQETAEMEPFQIISLGSSTDVNCCSISFFGRDNSVFLGLGGSSGQSAFWRKEGRNNKNQDQIQGKEENEEEEEEETKFEKRDGMRGGSSLEKVLSLSMMRVFPASTSTTSAATTTTTTRTTTTTKSSLSSSSAAASKKAGGSFQQQEEVDEEELHVIVTFPTGGLILRITDSDRNFLFQSNFKNEYGGERFEQVVFSNQPVYSFGKKGRDAVFLLCAASLSHYTAPSVLRAYAINVRNRSQRIKIFEFKEREDEKESEEAVMTSISFSSSDSNSNSTSSSSSCCGFLAVTSDSINEARIFNIFSDKKWAYRKHSVILLPKSKKENMREAPSLWNIRFLIVTFIPFFFA